MSAESKLYEEEKVRVTAAVWLQKKFKWVLALCVLGLLIWGGNEAYKAKHIADEQRTRDSLFPYLNAIEDIQKKLAENDSDINLKDQKKIQKNKIETLKNKETFTANFADAALGLDNAIRKNIGYASAARAAMSLADLYLEYGMPEKAESLLAAVDTGGLADLIGGLLRMQKAAVESSQNSCDKAIHSYQEVLANKSWDYLHAQALLRAASCNIQLDKMSDAKTQLSLILADHPDSSAARTAKIYQRLLKLKSKKVVIE